MASLQTDVNSIAGKRRERAKKLLKHAPGESMELKEKEFCLDTISFIT